MKWSGIVLILLGVTTYGQNTIGLPEVINYTKQAYSAGTQNWDIQQDRSGILYFANNEGLLTFDGTYWKLYPLPEKTNVRSLGFGPDGKIYVGSQGDIGYFSPGANGALNYRSLKSKIPEMERSFEDVWDVVVYNNEVFFRSGTKIFQLVGGKIKVYAAADWSFLGLSHGVLIAGAGNKLWAFEKDAWKPFVGHSDLPDTFLVTSAVPLGGDTTLLTTLKNGVFLLSKNSITKFTTPDLDRIARNNIYNSCLLEQDRILLATSLDGCFIINRNGNLLQRFAAKEGLQNNNIIAVFSDRSRNLWLGLDNGIDYIAYDNAIRHIYPDNKAEGSGYASLIHNGRLYIGATNGLYTVPVTQASDISFTKADFELVNNTKGQVWNLSEVGGRLFMGHHEGAFLVNGTTAAPFDKATGFWTFLPFGNARNESLMIAGTYKGIRFYPAGKGTFSNTHVDAQFESARFVAADAASVWVAQPYKGVYNVRLAKDGRTVVQPYGNEKGLISKNNNYIFKIQGRIVAATQKGVYEYNPGTDRFEESGYFKEIIGPIGVQYLKEDSSGNIWFVHQKSLGVIDRSGSKPKVIYLPELNNKLVSGFEFINPINSRNILVGGEKGFYHIDFEKYKQHTDTLQVRIGSVWAYGKQDSLLFGGYFNEANEKGSQLAGTTHRLPSHVNSFHFEYAATLYGQQAAIAYSYQLKGFDNGWSDWSRKTEKDYTYLPPGFYVFQVKARNNLGSESAAVSYAFEVLPPWYQTTWAYGLYACMLLAGALLLYRYQKKKFRIQQRRYEEEQARLKYLHQLELDHNEKEIVKLKNEKLEAEIEHKNTELASSAMHLVQKGELIAKVKEELLRLAKKPENERAVEELKKMIRVLGEDDRLDEGWQQFAHHFDKVHSDFLMALKNKHPNLSPSELKLCAYLRMNLSSKEIAQLIGISVRGVEISRYRLRKKMQLATETNLFEYLLQFQSADAGLKSPVG